MHFDLIMIKMEAFEKQYEKMQINAYNITTFVVFLKGVND